MSEPLRMLKEETLYHCGSRTLGGCYFIRPEFKAIIGLAITIAQDRYKTVKLYASDFMLNHFHMLLSAGDPKEISWFMRDVKSYIAKKINEKLGRDGTFWDKRFHDKAALDDELSIAQMKYIFLNPVKKGYCRHARDWWGHTTVFEALGEEPRTYEWFDQEAFEEARKQDATVSKEEFIRQLPLKVEPLPAYAGRPEEYAEALEEALTEAEREYAADRKREGRRLKGKARLRSLSWSTPRPKPKKKGNRERAASTCPKKLAAWREQRRQFYAAYRTASEAFRNGKLDAKFPRHAFRPPLPPAPVEESLSLPLLA